MNASKEGGRFVMACREGGGGIKDVQTLTHMQRIRKAEQRDKAESSIALKSDRFGHYVFTD